MHTKEMGCPDSSVESNIYNRIGNSTRGLVLATGLATTATGVHAQNYSEGIVDYGSRVSQYTMDLLCGPNNINQPGLYQCGPDDHAEQHFAGTQDLALIKAINGCYDPTRSHMTVTVDNGFAQKTQRELLCREYKEIHRQFFDKPDQGRGRVAVGSVNITQGGWDGLGTPGKSITVDCDEVRADGEDIGYTAEEWDYLNFVFEHNKNCPGDIGTITGYASAKPVTNSFTPIDLNNGRATDASWIYDIISTGVIIRSAIKGVSSLKALSQGFKISPQIAIETGEYVATTRTGVNLYLIPGGAGHYTLADQAGNAVSVFKRAVGQ